MVDAAFGALVEPMGHRLAHALHKTAVSAAHGMYARLSQYVPGENLDNTAGLLPPNLPDYLSRCGDDQHVMGPRALPHCSSQARIQR